MIAMLRRPRITSPRHLVWLRSLHCVIRGPGHEAEVAHIRYADARFDKRQTGMGERPSDQWSVPLSPEMHRLGAQSQHTMNERRFWERHSVDPVIVAAALWINTGDTDAAERILAAARAG